LPDDVKLLAHPVMAHRISLDAEAEFTGTTVSAVIDRILSQVAPPAQRAA
jgi:MoxR-like ATPase